MIDAPPCGAEALKRDRAFFERMLPHFTPEEVERYGWLSGRTDHQRLIEYAEDQAYADLQRQLDDAHESGREAGAEEERAAVEQEIDELKKQVDRLEQQVAAAEARE